MQHFFSLALPQRLCFIYPNLQRRFCKYDSWSPTHNKCTTKILYISYDALVHIITKRTTIFFLQRFFVRPSMIAKFTMSVLAQTWCVYTTSGKSAIFNLQRSFFCWIIKDICEYPNGLAMTIGAAMPLQIRQNHPLTALTTWAKMVQNQELQANTMAWVSKHDQIPIWWLW